MASRWWGMAGLTALAWGCSGPELSGTCAAPTLELAEGSVRDLPLHTTTTLILAVITGCSEPVALEGELQGDPAFVLDFVPSPAASRDTLRVQVTPATYADHQARVVVRQGDEQALLDLMVSVSGDQDGDGERAMQVGGDDCDDLDASVRPGADEVSDGQDNDCDGLIDEHDVREGDVWISEVFTRPTGGLPSASMWIEVQSGATEPRYLKGWTLGLGDARYTVLDDVVLSPGGRLVLGPDPSALARHGVPCDGALLGEPPAFDWTGVQVQAQDRVSTALGASGLDMERGRSLGLDPDARDPDATNWWCSATSRLGTGELGTPGAANDACYGPGVFDDDGDGVTVGEGDCDDTRADIYPGAAERWNGLDDSCDGLVDRLDLASGGRRAALEYLPFDTRVQSLDFGGDGVAEVILHGSRGEDSLIYTGADLLDGDAYPLASYYTSGSIHYDSRFVFAGPWDLGGDEASDLLIVGRGAALLVYTHVPSEALFTYLDADVTVAPGGRFLRGAAIGDVDGEGRPELAASTTSGLDVAPLDDLLELAAYDDRDPLAWEVQIDEMITGDGNGDGYEDLYLLNREGELLRWNGRADLSAWNGVADGVIEGASLPLGPPDDLDGDGVAELLFSRSDRAVVEVIDANGSGTASLDDAQTHLTQTGSGSMPARLSAPRADGRRELAIMEPSRLSAARAVYVLDSLLPTSGTWPVSELASSRIQDLRSLGGLVDLDNDGDLDLLGLAYDARLGTVGLYSLERE